MTLVHLQPCCSLADTSREKCEGEENGKGYHFVTREFMQEGCRTNMFLEYGEYNGNIYGTSLDTVRDVLKEHKMCVVDTNPAVRYDFTAS